MMQDGAPVRLLSWCMYISNFTMVFDGDVSAPGFMNQQHGHKLGYTYVVVNWFIYGYFFVLFMNQFITGFTQ